MSAPNRNSTLYAWVTVLDDGSTSLVGALVGKLHTPLIATGLTLAASFQPIAEAHARSSGQPVSLRRYDLVKVLHEIEP
jgi:hypothetical protein